jgi:hypothetical protein
VTPIEILAFEDGLIKSSSTLVIQALRAWREISKQEPSACDCMLKVYLEELRNHYQITPTIRRDMKNDIYFDGQYYDSETITDEQKEMIKAISPNGYKALASRYKWKVEEEIPADSAIQYKKKNK